MKDLEHNVDEDVGAVDRNRHVECILDVIATPLGLFNARLQLLDGIGRFVFEHTLGAEVSRAFARLKVFLPAEEVSFNDDLRTLVVEGLRLELVLNQCFGKQRVRDLSPHVFEVDEDGQHVNDEVPADCADAGQESADFRDPEGATERNEVYRELDDDDHNGRRLLRFEEQSQDQIEQEVGY